jgi:hypothetical protein
MDTGDIDTVAHELLEVGSDGCCTTWACTLDRCTFRSVIRTIRLEDGVTRLTQYLVDPGDGSAHNGPADLALDLTLYGDRADQVLAAARQHLDREELVADERQTERPGRALLADLIGIVSDRARRRLLRDTRTGARTEDGRR